MKKTVLFMAAVLFILSVLTGTVLAADGEFETYYTAAATIPEPGTYTFTHTLQLTEDPYNLPFNLTYTFTITTEPDQVPQGLTASEKVVEGYPTFSGGETVNHIHYGPTYGDDFTADPHSITKELTIDWNNVDFHEPGEYAWIVTKTLTPTDLPIGETGGISNYDGEFYLWAYVIDTKDPDDDDKSVLQVAAYGIRVVKDEGETVNKELEDDVYPIKPFSLEVTKTVSGTQGSKDQYFPVLIWISGAGDSASKTYLVTGTFDPTDVLADSPYNKDATQVFKIGEEYDFNATTSDNPVTVWLKHGQNVIIKNIPVGSRFSVGENEDYVHGSYAYDVPKITESNYIKDENAGTMTWVVSDPTTQDYVIVDNLDNDKKFEFENHKEPVVPTGIDLESGAPLMGLILAVGLVILALVPTRREEND